MLAIIANANNIAKTALFILTMRMIGLLISLYLSESFYAIFETSSF